MSAMEPYHGRTSDCPGCTRPRIGARTPDRGNLYESVCLEGISVSTTSGTGRVLDLEDDGREWVRDVPIVIEDAVPGLVPIKEEEQQSK